MSYPRKLQILVIEDDSDVIDGYRTDFAVLGTEFQFIEPTFVRSFTDAKKQIDGPNIFHVVVLDLNLPMETRGAAVEGLAPGEQLLEELAKRDDWPVPVVLVISGKLNYPHSIRAIQDRLLKDFWRGNLVIKSSPDQHGELREGLAQALRYVDVGVHIRDSGQKWYPTLTPREDDLLRRCILSQQSSLGVDVRWWGAETGASTSDPSLNLGPTKVLMGHFLFDEGMGISIPTFFKFDSTANATHVCRDVAILAQKLGHVKVFNTIQSRRRTLIVTQSATNRGLPISLEEYLHLSVKTVTRNVVHLVDQVVNQLAQLGEAIEDEASVNRFLWKYLDRETMARVWARNYDPQLWEGPADLPLQLWDTLKSSTSRVWASRRACVHGDLNATNVAIDTTRPGDPQAYIFDAAGMGADFEYRDLATLEVTTILFNSVELGRDLFATLRVFYDREFLPSALPVGARRDPFLDNVFALISGIRGRIQSTQQRTQYALLIFDATLRQVFGLGIQPSPNKVRNPAYACRLAGWAAGWLQAVAPELTQSAPRIGGA